MPLELTEVQNLRLQNAQYACDLNTVLRWHAAPTSRNHALRVFKAFGKFLVDEGILDENVFRLIPQAKFPERLIEPPTVEAVSTLLDGEIPTTWPARDWVELELLYEPESEFKRRSAL